MMKFEPCLEFIRCCLDANCTLPQDIEGIYWEILFKFCQEQAIAGIAFQKILEKSRDEIKMPRGTFLSWLALNEQIKLQNILHNKLCVDLVEQILKDGFRCCVLKGQGNAVMYPNPYSRNSGDIDLWVFGGRENVINYVKKRFPHASVAYQHIDFPIFKDVPVEIHCLPIYVNNPFYNQRLQKWFSDRKDGQINHYVDLPDGVGKIPVPTIEFNIVYQLTHLMHHFFDEGIGLRQMMDYYYLLKTIDDNVSQYSKELKRTLEYLNLYKFARAVMYVMKEVLGLDDKFLIAPIDEKRGKTLLREILKGGNFGKYSSLTRKPLGIKHFMKIWRDMHFVCEYPSEALFEPFFRTWHFFWRMAHKKVINAKSRNLLDKKLV